MARIKTFCQIMGTVQRLFLLSGLIGLTFACAPPVAERGTSSPAGQQAAPLANRGEVVKITLLQINDVYEMTPLGGQGGLARVASLKQHLLAENPNTFALLAGDFVSPSAIGLAKVDGQRLAGKQMIAALNPFLDYVTIGNHEFDIKREELIERIAESRFQWFSSNVFQQDGQPLPAVVPHVVIEVGADPNLVRIGMFGLTLDSSKVDWVSYDTDLAKVAREQVRILKEEKNVDILIALTHLQIEQDMELAEAVPELDLILGGHEHENMQYWRGPDFTPIYKADANARTVYIHRLTYDLGKKQLAISSSLRMIDERLPDDPGTAAIVKKWVDLALDGYRQQGVEPEAVVATPTKDLDGRESNIRNEPTVLTQTLANAMADLAQSEVSIFNAGSIRIDDVLSAGVTLTEYDILRVLPFGGNVVLTGMKGELLARTLDQGLKNKGKGGYLQYAHIEGDGAGAWKIGGKKLDPGREYTVALTDFLLTGQEAGLSFLKCGDGSCQDPGLRVIKSVGDIRKALIARLKKEYP